MTEKYRKIVNKPIKKVHSVFKNVEGIDVDTKPKKILKGSALVGIGLVEFMMRFSKFVALDNKILRKLEKKLSEIQVGKDKDGNEKKFQAFVKRNPNLSAIAIWWAMLGVLVGGVDLANGKKVDKDNVRQKKEIKTNPREDKIDEETTVYFDANDAKSEIDKKLNKKIKMTDKAAVKKAVMDNFAYTQAVLFATENYRTDWFCDYIKGPQNTLAVGLYYVPNAENAYNFEASQWALASDMFKKYPRKKGQTEPRGLTDDEVYDAIEGWFFYMDNGLNFNRYMRDVLAGTNIELTPRDLTVISSVLFNSPACCKKFCQFIIAHPDNRTAWAKYLLRVDDAVDTNRLKTFPGLKARRVHEILLLLDIDNYCQDMFGVRIDCKRSGAVSYANNYFDKLKVDFSKSTLVDAKRVICRGVVANGVSVCQVVQRSEKYSDDVFAYCADVDKYLHANQDRQQMYDLALKYYKNQNYDMALKYFNKVIELEGVSPELFNDLAITYIHRDEYDKSIDMSKKALELESEDADKSRSYFNLGLAYDLKGDMKNAKKFYTLASNLGNKVAASKLKKINENEIQQFSNATQKVNGKSTRSKFFKGLFGKRDRK